MDYVQPQKYASENPETYSDLHVAPRINKWLLLAVSFLVGVGGWYLLTYFADFPAFILPTPWLVFQRLVRALSDGTLLWHTAITLGEVMIGLALGVGVATLLGYWLAKSPQMERFLAPYIVASQSVPVVAIAPLLVIWFGPGLLSKVLICALIVFFPVLVNIVVGLRSVSKDLRDMMRSLRATRWQMLIHLEIPAAMPVLLGGLRIGATLSVIGAVVGEYVGADRGLGFLINVGRGQYDTALVFVAIFALVGMAMSLYGVVVHLENRLLAWNRTER
ncbi:MAG: ABC transporter permease [Anaerolineales bacterium]|nr:ABC transporter permease [Anaerolineales bacterium]